MSVPDRFLENMGTHIFRKKGVPSTTQQLSGLWKNWAPSVDFFMAITLTFYHILNIKITSQSLSNLAELFAYGS